MSRTIIAVILLLTVSCGRTERQTEDYGIKSLDDLTLRSENHPHGYGKSECFFCHLPNAIHRVNRLNAPSFSIANDLVRQSGLLSCSGCHGSNGVGQ